MRAVAVRGSAAARCWTASPSTRTDKTAAISIIVAVAENGVDRQRNRLPWRLPDDLKRFKELSLGKPIVMGRRTFDSIGRPLPGRQNIVVSRNRGLTIDGAVVVAFAERGAGRRRRPRRKSWSSAARRSIRQALPRYGHDSSDARACARRRRRLFPELDPAQWRETAVDTMPRTSVMRTPSASSPCRESRHDALRLSQVPRLLLQPRPHRGERLRHRAPCAPFRPDARPRRSERFTYRYRTAGSGRADPAAPAAITSTSRSAASSTARSGAAPCTKHGRTCAGAIRTARSAVTTTS